MNTTTTFFAGLLGTALLTLSSITGFDTTNTPTVEHTIPVAAGQTGSVGSVGWTS